MCSSQTTQSTTLPPSTEAEKKFLSIFQDAVMPQMLEEAGFRLEDSGEDTYGEEFANFSATLDNYAGSPYTKDIVQVIKNNLPADPNNPSPEEIENLKKTINYYSGYEEDGVRDMVNVLNANMPVGRKKGFQLVETDEAKERRVSQEAIATQFQENTLKFLQGDFSITEAQREHISEVMGPAREAVSKMYDKMDEVVAKGEDRLTALVDNFNKYEEQRQNVEKELFEQGIRTAGEDISRQVMNNAVASGRDPADPEFTAQISTMVSEEARKGGLQLQGMQIDRRAQHERELLDAQERLRQEELGVAQSRGAAELSLADQTKALRMAPLTGGGQGAIQSTQLIDAIQQQRQRNVQGAGGAFGSQAEFLRGERMAQAETTQTSTPSYLSMGLGLATGGANIYSGIVRAGAASTQAARLREGQD